MTNGGPAGRWQPSRAGILNVYQYQDEVLEFAGGRLLLRGVNGSGKSTAMNMLLPFLLEADVRKIDAAGEQRGVLRSWMLSDNDDTQRTGYLWIEFRRAGPGGPDDDPEYRTVGCGIRANRSTDRVTTWWFSTDRRVKLDVRLTEADVPFSADVLRSELGARGQVFGSTAEYRAEIARRFFGGTDPSAYFRLLHQVRNPRVGDRIDTDLPRTLREALPPVPEDAVSDAAQPLEDLEDHRRNVTDLTTTAEALDTVVEIYTDYARRVLATEVEAAGSAVDAARTAARRLDRDRAAAERARTAQDAAVRGVDELATEERRATAERQGLVSLPEFTAHAELLRRRDELARADAQAQGRRADRDRAVARTRAAADRAAGARGQLESDLAGVTEQLAAVATAARAASAGAVVSRLPDPPVLVTEPRHDEAGETSVDVPAGDPDGRPEDDTGPARVAERVDPTADLPGALTAAGDALRAHRSTVRGLRESALTAAREGADADRAETEAAESRERAAEAGEQADLARRHARDAADAHREALATWVGRLEAHVAAVPAAEPGGPVGWLALPPGAVDDAVADDTVADTGSDDPDPAPTADRPDDDLRALADRAVRAARARADAVGAELAGARSRAGTRVESAAGELAELRAEHARVEAATELPLPRAGWRTDTDVADAALFASVVDFRDGLDDAARAGIEAALEASGLLAAAVHDDGTVRGGAGELLLAASGDVPAAGGLDRWLVPADTGTVDPAVVARVLAAVGTAPGPGPWVADDGSFGAGPLRGRHAKDAAEHVGAGARARARERRLAELAVRLREAEERLAGAQTVLSGLDEHAAALRGLVREIPSTRPVDDAVAAATGAVRYADEADRRAAQRAGTAREARRRADEGWARLQQSAGEAGLPTDPVRLEELAEAVGDAERALAAALATRERTRRSVSAWLDTIAAWERDAADHAGAVAAHRGADEHAGSVRTELETIEGSLGEEPAKVAARVAELDDHLRDVAGRLETAREEKQAAAVALAQVQGQVETATGTLAEREAAARAARRRLVDAVDVPGLLPAAERDPSSREPAAAAGTPTTPDEDIAPEPVPATPDTLDGAAELVTALRTRLPAPRTSVTEDALEKALRTARDALTGGGRDIESRRSADGMPVAVFVTSGSRATLARMVLRVAVQRRQAEGLLSAQQDQALRNLLHGRIAREVADALFAARELVERMNGILRGVTSSQGIGVRLQWRPRADLDADTATALELLGKHPDLREPHEDDAVREAVSGLVEQARAENPEASYRAVIGEILDYRTWHEMRIYLRRPGRNDELLTRRTTLSEGEKKLVTVLPMASAAAASAAAHDPHGVGAPRLVLLDDAFAKVSEDNHAKLFGLLVDLDVDFVVTSERLWGTHPTVPALAITEVLRDPELRAIALVHYRWDGHALAVTA